MKLISYDILQFKTYCTYPNNRARGGTTILTRINISPFSKFQKDFLQGIIIKVKLKPNYGKLSIATVYCPPKNNLKKENFQKFFKMLRSKFIMGNDFNSKYIFISYNYNKRQRIEQTQTVEEKNYSILSTYNFIYWPTNLKKDFLDFFVIEDISTNLSIISNHIQ